LEDEMKKNVTLAVFVISLIAHVYFGYFASRDTGAGIASQPAFDTYAEYDCQMLMAETSDWAVEDIIEACQP